MTSTKRYHEFDALRGFAMLLGIVLHGLLSFMFIPIWPAQDIHQNQTAYGLPLFAIHGFRMPVFFLISGFFTAMMWTKRGTRGLVVHRAKRILLPLIVGTIVVWPMIIGLGYWGGIAREKRVQTQPARADIWNAAKKGDLLGLQRMIDQSADVNGRDGLGVSPLEWAALHGNAEAIALLVDNGANVNARNPQGSTALHAAACFGRTECVRTLIQLGADPGAANDRGDTPLQAARVDMGIVQYFAGILGMEIDTQAVAVERRETAAYLQTLQASDSIAVTSDERTAGSEPNAIWRTYVAATFLPVFHHLWFLYYLLWLVGIFLVAVQLRRWIPLRTPSWIIATPWCLFWLVPLTLIPQLFMTQSFGVDTAPGLLPWLPTLGYYTIFFGFGALCFGRREFEEKAGRYWPMLFAAALPVLLVGLHFFEARERGGNPAAHAITSVCAVVYAWLMVFGMIGFFRRFFAKENSRIRYLSDSSYWLYLVHLPLILGLQIWVSNWDIHHFPKFILVCTLTFVVLIASYEYLVRYTFIGTALNGRKTRLARITRAGRDRGISIDPVAANVSSHH